MRSRTTTWFETKIRYDKMQDDGKQKKETELYVVDALSFTEAENRIVEEMSSYISGEFEVKNIAKATYGEIFFSDKDTDDKWYKVKLLFITIDEKTEKEVKRPVNYIVQAHTLLQAITYIQEVMGGTMIDYEIAAVANTNIIDVFEHYSPAKQNTADTPAEKPEYEQ